MHKHLFTTLALAALLTRATAADWKVAPDWLKLPEGRAQLGNQHGDVAVSANGEVYVSILNPLAGAPDPQAGLQVFSPEGKYLRNVPGAPPDFHGFVIRKEKDGEFIYGPRLAGQTILKMTLDGKVVLEIPASAIPDEFKKPVAAPKATTKKKKDGSGKAPAPAKPAVRLTAMDVAPNGDLFVTDGYSSDFVHRFDRNGKYLKSFGGKAPPYSFSTLHKIAIDTRFNPPRIIGCDRGNMRVVHLSLDGELLGVIATDMLMPAAVAIHGDYAAIGEIKGQVTLLDKAGKVAAKFGTNGNADEVGNNKTEPAKWRPGFVTAPHGVAFNAHGDVFVSEYSLFGRVHRFNRQ
ncbi:MAG: hypothetical protein HZA89_07225 [Verrucomicrobia bacterium]|nr:hypothetical protein [Verrucomicrobiota bacterium]